MSLLNNVNRRSECNRRKAFVVVHGVLYIAKYLAAPRVSCLLVMRTFGSFPLLRPLLPEIYPAFRNRDTLKKHSYL